LLLLLPLLGCAGAGAETGAAATGPAGPELVARRGTLRERLVLTGELKAGRATELVVPRTSSWQLQIRWMEKDGTPVRAGQKVVEFDNSQFTSDLDEKRLTQAQAADDLEKARAAAATAQAEKQFAVEEKKNDLAKARIAAAVPQSLLPLLEYQERQLAVRKAEAAVEKAEADLTAERQGSAADLGMHAVELEKARREIRAAEEAIASLVLTAPRDGIVLAAEHPWEGRKVQEGDNVYVGLVVMSLPDLASLAVDAALSDVDDGRVRPGMTALCTLDAYPGESFTGRVLEVSAVAREAARSSLLRSFKVRLGLDRVDTARMRPGMSVKVEVLGPEVKDALLAPRAGLDLAEPPRARLAAGGVVPVRLGPCDAAACVVLSGLAPGTRLRPAGIGSAG
jgi:multidrug efflux pump subunit AcrA (membrane-fusion protein)